MATRASIIMKEKGKPIMAMYKHYDGYPSGLGKTLKDIIEGGKLVNGLGLKQNIGEVFNGAGCMFASIIAKLKTQPGDVYITSLDDVGKSGEDYIYEIDVVDSEANLTQRKND